MDQRGRLGLTRGRDLGIAGGVGAALALGLLILAEALIGRPPLLPWTGPLALLFAAAIIGAIAFTTWRRIQVRRERIEPERGVTFLALGKASALGGSAIAAGYLVFVIFSATNLEALGPQQRVVRGAVAAVAGVLIGAAGLWLERACRVPDPPEDEDSESEPEPDIA